jgi:hypothetical protein
VIPNKFNVAAPLLVIVIDFDSLTLPMGWGANDNEDDVVAIPG